MATILIIGAGLGGIPLSFELHKKLGNTHAIVVVNDGDHYHFVPSNPWIVVGWRRPENISVPLAESLEQRGIRFIEGRVGCIEPSQHQVILQDGTPIHYDHLVLATGPRPAFEEIPGFGPDHYTHSIVHIDHAIKARDAWERFIEKPGDIIVGAVQGSSLFGPAYEFAFIVDRDLRERHVRDKARILFVTPEPYIGHLGYGGVGDSNDLLEKELRKHDIEWLCNTSVKRIFQHHVEAVEITPSGETRSHFLHSDFTMLLPAFTGVDAIKCVPGLGDEHGFVKVDAFQRSLAYPDIWCIGTAVAIEPEDKTDIPLGVPKSGLMIESMVSAAAENITAVLEGREPSKKAVWNAIYLADMGNTGIAFMAFPQLPPRQINTITEGRWVHLAKVAFESYFLKKIRSGTTDHVYEDYVVEQLGKHS